MMKHILQALAFLLAVVVAAPVAALGLGKLEHDSALNERFEARIELLSVTAEELNTLKVGLADEQAFRRADINYASALSQLRLKLVEPQDGSAYIHITSDDAIREPFLNFLVELSWASGRIYREYTVLLDPPLYDVGRSSPAESPTRSAPAPAAPETPPVPEQYSHTVNYPDQEPVRPSYRPGSSYTGDEYGPIQPGETLWSIANMMRPADVTTHQMMLALLRTNPDAFIGNNINALKRGAILQMPSEPEMNAIGASAALAQVRKQHDLWEQARQSVAADPAPRGESSRAAASAPDAAPGAATETITGSESESRLELVAATDGSADQQTGSRAGADTAQKLALANEQIESLRQEKADLEDQLAENEALIEDLKRLISLKDDELATLQDSGMEEAAATDESPAARPLQQNGHTVNYPNGDPSQFINQGPAPAGVAPAPATSGPEALSHTVNYPQGEPATETGAAADDAAPAQAAAGAEAKEAEPAETRAAEPPAETAAAQPTTVDGIMATLAGLATQARNFIMANLMLVGGALLALIVLLAGMSFVRRRREAAADKEAEALLASGGFPDMGSDSADATSFDTGSKGINEFGGDYGEDEAPTEVNETVVADNDDTLFDVPEDEVAAGPTEEEDPLAEVNVLMAYEHFDQAESFVRNALKSDPDNVEYQAKLLEVFYAAGNKKKYEDAASDLRDMTGGQGEHWNMAVAMWQELSPNRPLFEDADDDENEPLGSSTGGGGGIVDITSDTAGGTAGGGDEEGTSGGIDFDLGDSTGGGKAGDDSDSDMLDLTASQDESDDGVLDLTASSQQDDDASDSMLDLTSSTGSMDALDDTRTLAQTELDDNSGQPAADDNSLDFSLDGAGGSDLLDVSRGGSSDDDDNILDVSASGTTSTAADDNSLDFSLDDMDRELSGTDEEETSVAGDDDDMDDNMLEFDTGSDDNETGLEAVTTTATAGNDSGSDGSFDDLDLQIESYDDSADLEEIGEELDRLEQTLGTLSRQELSQSSYNTTSDALDGIDSALEGLDDDSAADETESADSELSDISSEFELSLDDDTNETEDGIDDDLSALSIELDEESETSNTTDGGDGLDFDFNSAGDDLDIGLDESEDSEQESGFDLNSEDFSLNTVQMDAVDTNEDPTEHGFDIDFDLDADKDDGNESLSAIDMDSTVELPKNQPGSAPTQASADESGDDEQTLFVARSGDTDEQSLEDELTTKLDLAKAYVELGDADSARGILEEVMQDGSDDQKRQAGELLQQL